MKHRTVTPHINIGIATMTTILAVLCLTMFSLMTFQTARSNLARSRQLADYRQSYYAASNLSEDILGAISDKGCGSASYDTLRKVVNDAAKEAGFTEDLHFQLTGNQAGWRVPIRNSQMLNVTVQLKQNSYRVIKWQVTQ